MCATYVTSLLEQFTPHPPTQFWYSVNSICDDHKIMASLLIICCSNSKIALRVISSARLHSFQFITLLLLLPYSISHFQKRAFVFINASGPTKRLGIHGHHYPLCSPRNNNGVMHTTIINLSLIIAIHASSMDYGQKI